MRGVELSAAVSAAPGRRRGHAAAGGKGSVRRHPAVSCNGFRILWKMLNAGDILTVRGSFRQQQESFLTALGFRGSARAGAAPRCPAGITLPSPEAAAPPVVPAQCRQQDRGPRRDTLCGARLG